MVLMQMQDEMKTFIFSFLNYADAAKVSQISHELYGHASVRKMEIRAECLQRGSNFWFWDSETKTCQSTFLFKCKNLSQLSSQEGDAVLRVFNKLININNMPHESSCDDVFHVLSQAAELDFAYSKIKDLRPLNGLKNLNRLVLSGNLISEYNLLGVDSLQSLNLEDNLIGTLEISSLPRLQYLYLSGNPLDSLSIKNTDLYHIMAHDTGLKKFKFENLGPNFEFLGITRENMNESSTRKLLEDYPYLTIQN